MSEQSDGTIPQVPRRVFLLLLTLHFGEDEVELFVERVHLGLEGPQALVAHAAA